MRVLIIEDEKLTARDLASTIKQINPEVEILPFIHSVKEGLSNLSQDIGVDLIFSDVELGDGLSFEIFDQLSLEVPVIFCTAYEQYMLEAFNSFGIDYILKPFNTQTIQKTLEKYQVLKQRFTPKQDDIRQVLQSIQAASHKKDPSIIIHKGDRMVPYKISDFAVFSVEAKIIYGYTFKAEKISINEPLNSIEERAGVMFFRANRQFLVNRRSVKDASQYFHRKLVLNLTIPFDQKIIVNKIRKTELVNWLTSY